MLSWCMEVPDCFVNNAEGPARPGRRAKANMLWNVLRMRQSILPWIWLETGDNCPDSVENKDA